MTATTRGEAQRAANPALAVDDVVHQRVRLAILVVAHEAHRVEFTYLRDALDLTAGNLSRHLATLADAGLVRLTKDERGARSRTWVRITPKGRTALAREIALLDALVRRVLPASAPSGAGAAPG
ncbi:MAG TPA: transcriptional regulator [Cellulomonas sp.]